MILVIGSGPAGVSAALALVLVLEGVGLVIFSRSIPQLLAELERVDGAMRPAETIVKRAFLMVRLARRFNVIQ